MCDRCGCDSDEEVCDGCSMRESIGNKKQRMSDAALKMLDALWSALGWIEAEEVKHGRKFGAGNAIRDAIFEATGTRPIQDWNDENEEPTEEMI